MPDSGWTNDLLNILKMVFGEEIPIWILRLFGWALLLLVIFLFFLLLTWSLAKFIKLYQDELAPFFMNKAGRRQRDNRALFARYLAKRINDINTQEDWTDYHFSDLEAEVELEGRLRPRLYWLHWLPVRTGKRHVRSLSRALEISREPILLLEGEPGSGKSVALRHVALKKLEHVARTGSGEIPLYINLKEIRPIDDQALNSDVIEIFIRRFITAGGNRDNEEYMDHEFKRGMVEGSWLFIFDSFDEIPAVLSSTEANAVIKEYATAIESFLLGQNRCRAIIASRVFRGPHGAGWSRVTIKPLSDARKLKTIDRANLDAQVERRLVAELRIANADIQNMAANPLFLGLLCQHAHQGASLPKDAHTVFESYVTSRLGKDEERLRKRFNLSSDSVRRTAENIAFCMAAESKIGLVPNRSEIATALHKQGFPISDDLAKILDALIYLKLARSGSEGETWTDVGLTFTFAHRRFQEYFATCVVLREPKRVSPFDLLSNARWRETAVTLCQTQPNAALQMIINNAGELLYFIANAIPGVLEQPKGYSLENLEIKFNPIYISWPEGSLHLLEILQAGFANRLSDLPVSLRHMVGRIIFFAFRRGTLYDRRWVIERCGTAPEEIKLALLEDAVKMPGIYLQEAAYEQLGRLGKLSTTIRSWIRRSLVASAMSGRLRKEWDFSVVYMSRLDHARELVNTVRLLHFAWRMDIIILVLLLVLPLSLGGKLRWYIPPLAVGFSIIAYLYLWRLRFLPLFVSDLDQITAFGSAFLSIISRFILVLISLGIIYVYSGFDTLRLILLPLYFTCWSLLAILACLDGVFSRSVILWIFIPLSPISYISGMIHKTFGSVEQTIRWIRENRRLIISAFLFYSTLLLFLGILGVAYQSFIPTENNQAFSDLSTTVANLMIICTITITIIASIYIQISWMLFRNRLKKMDGQMFVEYLLKTPMSNSRKYIRHVRRSGLLKIDDASEAILANLVFIMDATLHSHLKSFQQTFNLKRFRSEYIIVPDLNTASISMQESCNWLVEYLRSHPKSFWRISSYQTVDDLALLLDQLRARRLQEEGPQ